MSIGASLPRFARQKPDAAALVCDGMIVSWAELWDAVQAIAHHLEDHCDGGRAIALILKNSPSLLAHFLACSCTGREAAVIDAAWPAARLKAALAELAPTLVYADAEQAISGAMHVDTRAALPRSERPFRARKIDVDQSFYIGFTSGSTGRPKGYRRSHQSWLTSFEGDRLEFGVTEDDVVLAPGSMTHSLFLYAAIHALQVGATVLMSRAFHPARALRMAREHHATIAYGAPTHWRMMIDVGGEPLPDLRWVLSSGAKWFANASGDLARLAPRARFAEFYGASELSFVAVRKSQEACPEDSVGRAFANVKISIRDDRGKNLPPGRIGRIFVESPYLFSDYATGGEVITVRDGAMTVGDMGFLDSSGFLHLRGRRDRMIVSSGKNVFAEEIERALESIPGVRAAAAFGASDEHRGEKIVAFFLPDGTRPLRRADLARAMRPLLPAPFIPHVFAIPVEWRWTASGKTDFRALRTLWDAGDWEEAS